VTGYYTWAFRQELEKCRGGVPGMPHQVAPEDVTERLLKLQEKASAEAAAEAEAHMYWRFTPAGRKAEAKAYVAKVLSRHRMAVEEREERELRRARLKLGIGRRIRGI
jgi:hypothetical protein